MCKVAFSLGLERVWENNFETGSGAQIKFQYAQVRSGTWLQGRIYVANEYPTYFRTMSIVSLILRISRQIIDDKSICFEEIAGCLFKQILGCNIQFLKLFSTLL